MRAFRSSALLVFAAAFAVAMAAASLVGCGGDDDGPTDPAGGVTVSLTAPADQAVVAGMVTLQANATDADRVVFFVDQTELGADTSAPYSFQWDSATATEGLHTVKARAEGGGNTAEDTATVIVDNQVSGVTVSVQPVTAQVAVNGTRQFTATVTGAANTAATWTVEGGAAFGTVSATGLYTAPGTLPNPVTATVRARSVADPAQSATAVVTITSDGGGGFPADQVSATQAAFSLGTTATDTVQSLLEDESGVVDFVFFASSLNGNKLTTTGTLTQSAPNSGDFTYSPQPTDRLILQFSPSPRVEIVISAFDGDLGSVRDFARFHTDLRFRIDVPDRFDITVASRSGTPGLSRSSGAAADPQTNIAYERTVTGDVVLNGQTHQVNLQLQGALFFEVDGSFANFERSDAVTGTMTGPVSSETINESSFSHIIVSDRVVENYTRELDNSATVGGVTLRLQTRVKRAFVEGEVADTDFWEAVGALSRNGTQVGTVRFSTPPIDGTPAGLQPRPVVDLGGGNTIQL